MPPPDLEGHQIEDELVDELVAEARSDLMTMPADMPAWMGTTIRYADEFSRRAGQIICWLVVPIFMAMVYEVIVRKLFTAPTLWAYDISRMLYGALFMLGSGYALLRGVHIRADFLYRTLSSRTQGMIDTVLYITLFFPSMLVFLYMATEYAAEAWQRMERLDDTAWRPLAAPIRTVMPISIFFLIVQGVSEVLKSGYAAWRGRWPHEQ